jgi:cytochrome c
MVWRNGKEVYAAECAVCHGESSSKYRAVLKAQFKYDPR